MQEFRQRQVPQGSNHQATQRRCRHSHKLSKQTSQIKPRRRPITTSLHRRLLQRQIRNHKHNTLQFHPIQIQDNPHLTTSNQLRRNHQRRRPRGNPNTRTPLQPSNQSRMYSHHKQLHRRQQTFRRIMSYTRQHKRSSTHQYLCAQLSTTTQDSTLQASTTTTRDRITTFLQQNRRTSQPQEM